MKLIIRVYAVLLLAVITLYSCSKDKGNYTYENINELQITTDMEGVDPSVFLTADSIEIHQNDSLKVRLKIEQKTGAKSDGLTYKWYITQYDQSMANPPVYQIANTASLAQRINLQPNLYRLVAKVTDSNTGVAFYKYFVLNVASAEWGGEGWVVLHENDGGSDISVITTRDGVRKGNVYRDVYSSINGRKLPLGTSKVNVINYGTNLRAQKVSFFYPGGGMQVKSIDFSDSLKIDDWFLISPGPVNYQANGSAGGSGSGYEYVIYNNHIAYRQFATIAHLNNPPKFYPHFEGLIIAPYVIHAASGESTYTLYDKESRGFTIFNAETSIQTSIADYSGAAANLHPTTGQGFDFKHIGDNLIHAENVQPMNASSTIYWNCFFRNDDQTKTSLIQFTRALGYKNELATGRYQLLESNCPGINSATLFANPTFLPLPRGIFYYVNQHQIYTAKVNILAGTTAQPNLTFSPGTVIKAMKVLNSGYTLANISSMGVPEGKVLVVATDETASGQGHNVYFFNIDLQTGVIKGSPVSPADRYTGFEKITDIVFKKAIGR